MLQLIAATFSLLLRPGTFSSGSDTDEDHATESAVEPRANASMVGFVNTLVGSDQPCVSGMSKTWRRYAT